MISALSSQTINLSPHLQTLTEEYIQKLTELALQASEKDRIEILNLIEKFQVALMYLHSNNHTQFWYLFEEFLVKEMYYREFILHVYASAEDFVRHGEQKVNVMMKKFGIYNNIRLTLLQELSNKLINLFEKASSFVYTSAAKSILRKANNTANFYINQFKAIRPSPLIEKDGILENCIDILENTVSIGKESIKRKLY